MLHNNSLQMPGRSPCTSHEIKITALESERVCVVYFIELSHVWSVQIWWLACSVPQAHDGV